MATRDLDVAFRGIEDLQRKLHAMVEETEGRFLVETTEKAAVKLSDSMEDLAPVADTSSGDRLSNNVGTEIEESSEWHVQYAVAPDEDVFYGGFQESGTVDFPAQPFMEPAAEKDGPRLIDEVVDTFVDEIEKFEV